MKKHDTLPAHRALGWILAAVTCAPLAAQTPLPSVKAPNSAEAEMKELFGKVEKRLREIDRLLSDASAGDRSALQKNADSGMDKLLQSSQVRGKEVLEGIDRILELARQLGGEKPGGGSGGEEPQKPDGQSQLDRRGEQSTEREPTPAKPEGEQPSPGPKPEKSDGSSEKPASPPKGNRDSTDQPANSPGPKPSPTATEAPNRNVDNHERWGELPVHVRDVFRIEGGGDMPVQYRDWIDSYYRRLNKKP